LPLLEAVMGLLESHGRCPSVVNDRKDQESQDLYTVREHLAGVNLRAHSYAVAIHMLRLLKGTPMDYKEIIPKAVITALAHDIGKIPEFRESGLYYYGREHTVTGMNKLKELAGGMEIYWLEEAAKAVRDHHVSTPDKFTGLLRKADRAARETELLRFAREYSIKTFSEWFDPEKYMRLIENRVNFLNSMRRWKAVSYLGVVYCFPDYIYTTARLLCRESKALDLTFMRESEKGTAIKLTVEALREAGFVSDMLPPGRCAWKFEITSMAGNKRFMLTPLVWDGFNIDKIERRKAGYLTSARVFQC
ncbi:MAG: HD domain-containing protein, partial [Thermodesulfobacteriota bacterium]